MRAPERLYAGHRTVIEIAMLAAITVLLIAPAIAAPVHKTQDAPEIAVRRRVDTLLSDLGAHRLDRLASHFTAGAVLIVSRSTEGGIRNSVSPASEWVEGMRGRNDLIPFEERLFEVEIEVDGGRLAYLRARFDIVREGQVVSHGVDLFTLVRNAEGWRVAAISYTSEPGPWPGTQG